MVLDMIRKTKKQVSKGKSMNWGANSGNGSKHTYKKQKGSDTNYVSSLKYHYKWHHFCENMNSRNLWVRFYGKFLRGLV